MGSGPGPCSSHRAVTGCSRRFACLSVEFHVRPATTWPSARLGNEAHSRWPDVFRGMDLHRKHSRWNSSSKQQKQQQQQHLQQHHDIRIITPHLSCHCPFFPHIRRIITPNRPNGTGQSKASRPLGIRYCILKCGWHSPSKYDRYIMEKIC